MRRLAVAVVLVLVGCGGVGDDGPPTVAKIAERLNKAGVACRDLEIDDASSRSLGAREEGTCETDGDESLEISIYNSNDARDAATHVGKQFGGIIVLGNRWAVSADNDATAKRVQDALGGKLA